MIALFLANVLRLWRERRTRKRWERDTPIVLSHMASKWGRE